MTAMRFVGIIATGAVLDPIGFHFRLRVFLPLFFLKKAGFAKIKNLKGGVLAWAEKIDLSAPKY